MKRIARTAAVTLLLLWVGPVSFVQNDTSRLVGMRVAPRDASAGSEVIPAGKALVLEPGAKLRLLLRDGTRIQGAFLGRTLMDSAAYAMRFAERAKKPPKVWIAMEETLRVTLKDRRQYVAPFVGYGERTLLLRGPDGEPLRVPFEYAKSIVRANGDTISPGKLNGAFRSGKLPSTEILALDGPSPVGTEEERWSVAQRVAVDDIESVLLITSEGGLGGAVVLGALAGAALAIIVIVVAINSAADDCGSSVGTAAALRELPDGVRLTDRPFDLTRGCYVGDPLAVADPWPGAPSVTPSAAAPEPTGSHAGTH